MMALAEGEEEGERSVRQRQRQGQPCPYFSGEPCWYNVINYARCENWEDSSEEDSDSDEIQNSPYTTFCGFWRAFLCPPSAPLPPQSSHLDVALLGLVLPQKPQLTAEEAEQNAKLLVAEEECLKKKAEKKRMKKKRQKDQKRQEKRNLELKAKSEANKSSAGQDEGTWTLEDGFSDSEGSPSRSMEEVEAAEEELDFCSTFVSKARRKVDAKSLLPRKEKGGKNPREKEADTRPKAERPSELQLTPVEQSLVLADCGNETAKQGLFREAVLLFTEAIKLNPQEYRLQSHTEALRDAQRALSLQPGWPKGLFRQGKALLGLKVLRAGGAEGAGRGLGDSGTRRYVEAARTFRQLLPLDGFRGDAALPLQKCHIQHALESRLGCSRPDQDVLPVETQLPLPGKQPGRQRCPGCCHHPAGTSGCQGSSQGGFAVWVENLAPKITSEFCCTVSSRLDPLTPSGASLASPAPSSTTATKRPPKPPTRPCRGRKWKDGSWFCS